MQKTKEILSDVALACSASVFYVSAVFLSEILLIKSTVLSLLYLVVTGLIYLFAMISKDRKSVLIKWLLSIFCGAGEWWLFIRCEYALRALNWVIPGYGRQSAGGSFAATFQLLILSLLCMGGVVISLFVKPKHYERFRRIQFIICMVLMVIILAIVFILERQFPSADYIRS